MDSWSQYFASGNIKYKSNDLEDVVVNYERNSKVPWLPNISTFSDVFIFTYLYLIFPARWWNFWEQTFLCRRGTPIPEDFLKSAIELLVHPPQADFRGLHEWEILEAEGTQPINSDHSLKHGHHEQADRHRKEEELASEQLWTVDEESQQKGVIVRTQVNTGGRVGRLQWRAEHLWEIRDASVDCVDSGVLTFQSFFLFEEIWHTWCVINCHYRSGVLLESSCAGTFVPGPDGSRLLYFPSWLFFLPFLTDPFSFSCIFCFLILLINEGEVQGSCQCPCQEVNFYSYEVSFRNVSQSPKLRYGFCCVLSWLNSCHSK